MTTLGYLSANDMEIVVCKQSSLSYGWHTHISTFTISFVYDGSLELCTDKTRNTYHKNDVFFLLPYTPHCIYAKSPYTLLTLCIHKNYLNDAQCMKDVSHIHTFLYESINNPAIESIFIQRVHTILSYTRIMPTPVETNLGKLKRRLELSPETALSIDDMAILANMNKYTLIRSFKHEFGLTPHQFLVQNRIRKAKKLLKTDRTITEVAMATGFYDQSHFTRHFEKLLGISPTEYKLACSVPLPLSLD